jgi:nitroimidazol reductase NimA-like FMN-containing flavoprotein (pyridoxamine 5'-phosphate oxidase superfamily)
MGKELREIPITSGTIIMAETKGSLNKIRRSKLAKDDAWIREFLHSGAMGTMATSRDGQPFLVTRNYVYNDEKQAIYMHGAMKGRTFENVQANNAVCFSVSEMGRLLPADEANEVGIEFAGVVVFGYCVLVRDECEAAHGLQLLLDKYFPQLISGQDYAPINPEGLKSTAVFRIDIESWSGKEKIEEEDFPGAFYYGSIPDG